MTLFFGAAPRIVFQGITGREARMVVEHTLGYGTGIAAGVTPGRAGTEVAGVPVFDTVESAAAATGGPFDAAVVVVPPLAALDAVAEAVAAGTRFVLVATENIPRHDAVRLVTLAREAGAIVVGPNSVGVIVPELRIKLGAIGGDRPDRAFVPGRIGIISRSGGLTAEAALQLRIAGLGVSTAISIGGDAVLGTTPADALRHFAADPSTDAVVYIGEPGTRFEHRLGEALEQLEPRKPLVALLVGRFTEEFPRAMAFGHAGAVIGDDTGLPSNKERRLREAGATVAGSFDELVRHVQELTHVEVQR
jgi:succinyl-CoA synthetase alpha subunit